MSRIKNKSKFLSVVLGNIVMFATVAALLLVTVTDAKAERAGGDKPYYSGKSETKISLMINVYWGTEYIEPMLEILESHNVKTTFFVGGSWAAANAEMLKRIHAAGHEIGNHGYYHKDHSKIDIAYNKREIQSAHDVVKDTIGVDMNLFAPPSGAVAARTLKAATEL
ncbi:MAG: polysaccharide deacetylase family protein, partial [Clostridiales bacterium]|nr:polysaccharide deacetylase family protein [Clostridiales bacterium]